MRSVFLPAVMLLAMVGHADDPLESLNSVEDTVSTMRRTLHPPDGVQEEAASRELLNDNAPVPKTPALEKTGREGAASIPQTQEPPNRD